MVQASPLYFLSLSLSFSPFVSISLSFYLQLFLSFSLFFIILSYLSLFIYACSSSYAIITVPFLQQDARLMARVVYTFKFVCRSAGCRCVGESNFQIGTCSMQIGRFPGRCWTTSATRPTRRIAANFDMGRAYLGAILNGTVKFTAALEVDGQIIHCRLNGLL